MKTPMFVLCTLLLGCAGCGSPEAVRESAEHMSEAKRDTLLAKSSVPGAATVGRALDAAGSQPNPAAQLDSLTH